MKLVALKNVDVEGLGTFRETFERRGVNVEELPAYEGVFPKLDDFDILVLLGGPMGVYDEDDYPFLKDEKELLRKALAEGKKVLGVCLGCQLLSEVLGGKVYRGEWGKEIGWRPIYPQDHLELIYRDEITVFHWHGDTFDIPDGCIRLASSQMYKNQAFRFGNRAVGLQFHLEVTPEDIEKWISVYGEEVKEEGIEAEELLPDESLWKRLKIYCDVFTEYFLRL